MIELGPEYFREIAQKSAQPEWMTLMADLDVHLCSKDGAQWTLDFSDGAVRHMDCKGGSLIEVLKRFEENVTGGVLINGHSIARVRSADSGT